MRNRGRVRTFAPCRCLVLKLGIWVAALCLSTVITSEYPSFVIIAPMTTEALFLRAIIHHRRSPPSSRSPKSVPSMVTSPRPKPNTDRRPRESRSASPLIAFYSMFFGRLGYGTESEKNERRSRDETDGNVVMKEIKSEKSHDEDIFSQEMIQRRQELQRRYENFRGRGRWGGYSLLAIQQESYQKPAPLPVVSTAATIKSSTSGASVATKSTSEHRKRGRSRRAMPMLQITDIQQYKDEIVDSTDASLVVVRFYASWCKACKAIEGSYHRLPEEFPTGVKFVEVPLTKENAYMHKGLGIPSLPFAHVYYNDDYIENNGTGMSFSSPCRLIEELKINKSKFSEFKRIIRSYVNKECDVYYASSGTENEDGSKKYTITIASASPLSNIKTAIADHNPETIPTH
mmetsp:Transcript_518/g.1154  ORF Transcript_518/g.1154 Transcript_518/m.1154 type:complete len:402 (-) Transcript_518:727-1932(-)